MYRAAEYKLGYWSRMFIAGRSLWAQVEDEVPSAVVFGVGFGELGLVYAYLMWMILLVELVILGGKNVNR